MKAHTQHSREGKRKEGAEVVRTVHTSGTCPVERWAGGGAWGKELSGGTTSEKVMFLGHMLGNEKLREIGRTCVEQ